ncbi:phosphatidylinositol-4- kinase [Phlyctochytrium planicorne]|nr:phosphatidylinositol-4- kinase [Phlyctochytrium planicorne]
MFYNQTKDGYLLDIFADAAASVALSSVPSMQDQIPLLVDVFCPDLNFDPVKVLVNGDHQGEEEGNKLIVHDSSHQLGLVGLLDFVLASKGDCREQLVSLCLMQLEKLPEMARTSVDVGFFGEEDPEHFESFSFEIGARLLKIAELHPDVREQITDSIWKWVTSLVENVLDGDGGNTSGSRTCLTGLASALSLSPPTIHSNGHLESLTLTLRRLLNLPKRLTTVGIEVLRIIRTFLAFLIDPEESKVSADGVWDALIVGKAVTVSNVGRYSALLQEVVKVCSVERWSVIVQESLESLEVDVVLPFFHACVQTLVFASLLLNEDQTEMIDKCFAFLRSIEAIALDSIQSEILLTTTEALAVLSKNNPAHAELVTEKITKCISDPNPALLNDADEALCSILRNCQGDVLAKCIKKSGSSSKVKSSLFAIINVLGTWNQRGHSATTSIKIAASCAHALKSVAPILKSTQLIEVVIPALVKVLQESQDDSLKEIIWRCLGDIGMSCDPDVFKEIFFLAVKESPSKISQVGKMLAKNARLTEALLEKVLGVFMEKAAKINQKASIDAATSTDLLSLASTLRDICENEQFPQDTFFSTEVVSLLRNFWIYAVGFLLKQNGAGWPEEWVPILNAVALRTPPLLLPKDRRNLEADLNSNSVIRGLFTEQLLSRCRQNLQIAFKSRTVDTKGVSPNSAVFLLAVFHMESLRVARSSLEECLMYLRDESYYNSDIYSILEVIVDEVMTSYLRSKHLVKSSVRRSIHVLIESSGYRLPKVRIFSSRSLKRLMAAVPGMLWDRKMIFTVIDLVQFLDAKNYSDSLKRDLLKQRLGFDIVFVDDLDRASAFNDFKGVASHIITMALERSASETSSLLQAYLADLQLNFPELFILEESYISEFMSKFSKRRKGVATDVVKSLSVRANYIGEIRGLYKAFSALTGLVKHAISKSYRPLALPNRSEQVATILKNDIKALSGIGDRIAFIKAAYPALYRASAAIVTSVKIDEELFHLVCRTSLQHFSVETLEISLPIWNWILSSRPELSSRTFMEIFAVWERTILEKKGLYSNDRTSKNPFMGKLTYAPSEKLTKDTESCIVHLKWLRFLRRKYKEGSVRSKDYTRLYAKFICLAIDGIRSLSLSSTVRETVFLLATLGLQIAEELDAVRDPSAYVIWTSVIKLAFEWFTLTPTLLKAEESPSWLSIFYNNLKAYRGDKKVPLTDLNPVRLSVKSPFTTGRKVEGADAISLLILLLENEMTKSLIWINPMSNPTPDSPSLAKERDAKVLRLLPIAWDINPRMAVHIPKRFQDSSTVEIPPSVPPTDLMGDPGSLHHFTASVKGSNEQLRYLMFWAPIPPVTAVSLLTSKPPLEPWCLQYAVYVLDYFPIEQVFFYVPQLVQALRYDSAGYIELFILKAAKFSQLFAHQIIWNMKANMFKMVKEGKHEEKMILLQPDTLKPTLDRIIDKIVASLSGDDQEFYEREFKFFREVTGISGKLKPFIQKSKAEKKKKIDEEMRLIKVDAGVYLPSNPDSIVIDIDYDSGRPLQSHAKAPFMATFKIKKVQDDKKVEIKETTKVDALWQSVIFKVGDDCRQDVLALQLISICKSIFANSDLDLYLYPYRVVATDPGCGIIEVIPKSISRDMMGREKVNSLPNYFEEKFGTTDSFAFRKAQDAFIRSLAAYSVILYIVSIKDRHNGNIMFDDQGHILHIDFGFILDIAPGGIEFEASPFKLTTEMIAIMGGDATTPEYKRFSDLVVRSYLAIRPYSDQIVDMVRLMLDSGLPCFKGEQTIAKLRDKFQTGKTDRQAADFMMAQIKVAHENQFSRMYDRFQNLQNGIPF